MLLMERSCLTALFYQMTSPPWSALALLCSSTLLMAPENLLKGVLRRSPAWWASLTEGEQSQGSWASRFILPDKPVWCLGWLAVPAAFTESHLGSKRSQRQILLWWRSPRTLVPRRFVLRIELFPPHLPTLSRAWSGRESLCLLSLPARVSSQLVLVGEKFSLRTIPLEIQKCSSPRNKSLMVALGTADCALMNLGCSLWDTCATEALVVAAGGKVSTRGTTYRSPSC